jgi:hypothetical protein
MNELVGYAEPLGRELRTVAFARVADAKRGLGAASERMRRLAAAIADSNAATMYYRVNKIITLCVPHTLRYLLLLLAYQIFPIAFGSHELPAISRRKCDYPLALYVSVTVDLALARLALGCFVAFRLFRRQWEYQSFGEALGTVWNFAPRQNFGDEYLCAGGRLNACIALATLADAAWWCFGAGVLHLSDPDLCARRVTSVTKALVGYQVPRDRR